MHVALPEGRKAHVAPSVTALPKIVMAAAMLEEMIGGTRVRSGGNGGGKGGGGGGGDVGGGEGEGGEGEGGGGEGEGGSGEGEGGGGEGEGGGGEGEGGGGEGEAGGGKGGNGDGGAGQVETGPETPSVRVVGQKQTAARAVPPETTWTLGPWAGVPQLCKRESKQARRHVSHRGDGNF